MSFFCLLRDFSEVGAFRLFLTTSVDPSSLLLLVLDSYENEGSSHAVSFGVSLAFFGQSLANRLTLSPASNEIA